MEFVLGIIPARGGSKGISNKNIRELKGKPLLAYTIEASRESSKLNDFILSTDSQTIADYAEQYGLTTNALRPHELASDTAKSIDVVKYEVVKYERDIGCRIDVIVLLQPTTPMRTAADIDHAIDIFYKSEADSLISVYEASEVHPYVMYYCEKDRLKSILEEGHKFLRRQEFKPVYVRNGALYIAKRDQVMEQNSIVCERPVAYIMPRERSVNIDEPFDLEIAEWMMSRYD